MFATEWNLETQACETVLHGHEHWIKALAVHANCLISGGWDESIFIWDINSLCLLKKVGLRLGPVSAIHVDNRKIVVHCRGKTSGNRLTVLNFGLEELLLP